MTNKGLILVIIILCCGLMAFAQDDDKLAMLENMSSSGIHPNDLAVVQQHLDTLTIEQIEAILVFLSDDRQVAHRRWFDITAYQNWDDYNFFRSPDIVALTNLARRDLFLDPARQLNNRNITNMSNEALAALVFSQAYVEEKWDHTVPWDGDNNDVFNWIQPELLYPPMFLKFVYGDYLYQERVRYWFATHYPDLLSYFADKPYSDGDDIQAIMTYTQPPISNVPRLAGYSYPIGNQLYLQTAETLLWYSDYIDVADERYGFVETSQLDTHININDVNFEVGEDVLFDLLNASFADELRQELTHPESASFWNVMRFVHAGARQREGGGSPEHPGNNQLALIALRYDERSDVPMGRAISDISAFSIITTVYSDSILLDFTNWDATHQTIIVEPINTERSDGIHRRMSERNKAVQVIEQIGDETVYTNATHIVGSRGLGLHLTTQYDDIDGDFLPYTPEEAHYLVSALVTEYNQYGIQSSRIVLCTAPLLQKGYDIYTRTHSDTVNIDSFCE